MKKTAFVFLILILPLSILAQDYILKRNGEELYGYVKEINVDNIVYKDTLATDSTLKSLKKSDVFMIKFKNGLKEVFKEEAKVQEIAPVIIVQKETKNEEYPIVEIGKYKYTINNQYYSFGRVRRILLNENNEEINKLLRSARGNGVVGNILTYSTIPFGYIGILALGVGVASGDSETAIIGGALTTVFFGAQTANIIFKVNKKKKIDRAIAIYNDRVNGISQQ